MVEQEKQDFSIKETREKIKQEIAGGFSYHPDEMKKWHRIRKGIEGFLKENVTLKEINPLIYEECIDLLDKAKWFSFVYLKSEDFINLFKQGLKYALVNRSYPLEKNISIFLIDIPILSVRDEYKKKIREAMFANEEKLTSGKITMGNKEEEPTISNWLKFYDMELGAGKVEKLKIMEILFKNENIIKLLADERQTIKRLIDLYEELKISALSVEGLEEEDYVVDENGEIELHRRNFVEQISREFAKMEQGKTLEEKVGVQEKERVEEIKKEVSLIDVSQAIEEVLKRINLNLPNEDLKNRFRNIILSFLRDIRTAIEIKIILKRETQIGGLGLSQEITNKIMDVLKEVKPRINQESFKNEQLSRSFSQELSSSVSLPTDKIEKIAQIETKIPSLTIEPVAKEEEKIKPKPESVKEEQKSFIPPPIKQTTIQKPEVILPKQEIKEKTLPSTSAVATVVEQVIEPKPESRQEIKSEVKPEIKPEIKPLANVVPPAPSIPRVKEEPVKTEIPIHRPFPQPQRPVVEEIKVKPRIYGPIDELKTITLADWRRWGSAKEAAKTIQDKIGLLAEESLVKKAEGIKAWKDSEVNQLYLDIGVESIDQGKSVNEIIIQRQQQNKPTLTEEEFNAVVELNQKMRF